MPFSGLAMTSMLIGITILLVLVAEFFPHLPTRRLAALASIGTVTAAIGVLLIDPPKGGDWPTLAWEEQGKAKEKRRGGHAGGGADGEDAEEREAADKDAGSGVAEGNSAAESLERVVVMAFRTPAPPGPAAGDVKRDCDTCPEMVLVPAGTARIGADDGDALATAAERPPGVVRIWPGFLLSRAEISVAEYGVFATATGRRSSPCLDGAGEPALAARTCITSDDAKAYAAWLSQRTGRRYRLPSAAEWEYVARAPGTDIAAQPVERPLNAAATDTVPPVHPWSLVGIGGGVAEITADCWRTGLAAPLPNGEAFEPEERCPARVLKDGADAEQPMWRRPSARRPLAVELASPRIGFRVVRALD